MKNTIAFLVSTKVTSIINSLHNELFLIKELKKKREKIYILDLSFLANIDNKKLDWSLKKKYGNIFKVIKITSHEDLKKFIYRKKLIFVNYVPPGLAQNQFKVWRMIKKFDLKITQVQNDQIRMLTEQNDNTLIKQKFFQKIYKFYNYQFFRVLVVLNYFPKVKLVFVSSKQIKEKFDNSIFRKIDDFFKINIFSFFKKIILVNIRFYNSSNLKKTEDKFITYIDTAPFDHPALTKFSNEKIDKDKRKIFYNNLHISLKKIEKIIKKKIIICLHPKYDLKYKKSDFKKLFCKTYKTEKYLLKSNLIIFQSTSMIPLAMILKKKIIQIRSNYLPIYFQSEVNSWYKLFKFTRLDIDLHKELNQYKINTILGNTKTKIMQYKKFINQIVHKKNINPANQIINFLEKYK